MGEQRPPQLLQQNISFCQCAIKFYLFFLQIYLFVAFNFSLPVTRADIDECEQPSNNVCDHECVNTVGSFLCRCHSGYILAPDRHSCIPVHNCELTALEKSSRDVYLRAIRCLHVVICNERTMMREHDLCHSGVLREGGHAYECWDLLIHLSGFYQHEKQPVAAEAEAGKHAIT